VLVSETAAVLATLLEVATVLVSETETACGVFAAEGLNEEITEACAEIFVVVNETVFVSAPEPPDELIASENR
jgi:hypothetical protein